MSDICTIKIVDEVNCKLEGLDIATRRKCVNALKYRLPYAHNLPSVRLGRWDGTVGFFSVGGGTQINLLDKILPIVESAGYQLIVEDMRQEFNFDIPLIDKDYNSDILWPADHPTKPGEPIELFDHQVTMVNNFLQNPQSIQTAPTSAGKTITTATLSKIVEPLGRTIVIVPNKDLVKQTLEDYLLLGLNAGAYFGDEKVWHATHTICTWQSMDRLLKDTKNGVTEDKKDIYEFLSGVVAVIVDEVHQAKADVLRKLLTGVLANAPIRWGLTGTIPKEEYIRASLLGSIGDVIEGPSAKELQELGVLSHCEIDIIQTGCDLKFNNYQDEYKFLTTNDTRLEWISDFINGVKETGNTLILVNRKATGQQLEKLIDNAIFVDGGTKSKDRKKEYSQVAITEDKVIIATFGIAAVGLNIPRIFNLVLFEPGKSFVRTIQSIGRGLRRAKDKDFVQIYDICAATKYSKKHLTERKKFYREFEYPFKITKVNIR